MQKLPALVDATSMLVCAEDLGMIPSCVEPVLRELHMLSLEIQSMPKQMGRSFGDLNSNPYYSVATISTHDMSPLRLWWEENPIRAQQYFNDVLKHHGIAPVKLTSQLAEEILLQHLSCPSMLCLLSLQDWLSVDNELRCVSPSDERINIPANPHHYWRYRMHLTIEKLRQATGFNKKIREMIENTR